MSPLDGEFLNPPLSTGGNRRLANTRLQSRLFYGQREKLCVANKKTGQCPVFLYCKTAEFVDVAR